AVYAIVQASGFFVGLSATPVPNGWISAANYFKMFGFTPNITAFKARYVNEVRYKGYPEIIGYHREDEIKALWNQISTPLKKEDAIDLPDVTEVAVPVSTPASYWKVIKERIFEGKLLENASAFTHALRQNVTE